MSTDQQRADAEAQETFDTIDADIDTHQIEATTKMVRQTIEDQASDLVDGWRELIQNGLDSQGSTVVELEYDTEHTVVRDNGDGEDLSEEDGIDLLTNLGETSKEELLDAIGEFGVGIFQAVCQARTAIISGDHALLYDYKQLGLDVIGCHIDNVVDVANQLHHGWGEYIRDELEGADDVDGFRVVMDHYEDQMPNYSWKWDNFEEDLEDRFEFAEVATATRIYVNGDRISNRSIGLADVDYNHTEEWIGDVAGRVHIGVSIAQHRDLTVYSNGVKVCNVSGHGLGGHIVTEQNLDLNFARNEIKSGCEKWAEIQERLEEVRLNLFANIPDDRLTRGAREFISTQMLERGNVDTFDDVKVFRTANEDYVSLETVKSRDTVCTARPGDQAADKLSESYGMVVLDKVDPATKPLIERIETTDPEDVETEEDDEDGDTDSGFGGLSELREAVEGIGTITATEKAEEMGMHTEAERVDMSELTPTQRQKLMVARELADRLSKDRKVFYGESDVYNGWTDGTSEIVITDSATSSNSWIDYVPELFRILVHENAHNMDTAQNDASHGRRFSDRYQSMMDDEWDVLTEVLADIRANDLAHVVDDAPKY